jgi:sulfonate transport system substrate-binding protein
LKNLHIGGVPEHFNLPWLDTLEGDLPEAAGVSWVSQPQGTGAMVAGLRAGDLDAALLLTEGAVAASAGEPGFEIVAVYVSSPLEWGIHVPGDSRFTDEGSIRGARYAISRYGSGSHLMSIAHARSRGWPTDSPRFVTVATLAGAEEAFAEGRADVFFWERVMTQPIVDAGRFRRVGVFAAPWPAFVLCFRAGIASDDRARIAAVFERVLSAASAFKADVAGSAARIEEAFDIEREVAEQWLSRTQWATAVDIDKAMLSAVAEVLIEAGVIDAIPSF